MRHKKKQKTKTFHQGRAGEKSRSDHQLRQENMKVEFLWPGGTVKLASENDSGIVHKRSFTVHIKEPKTNKNILRVNFLLT